MRREGLPDLGRGARRGRNRERDEPHRRENWRLEAEEYISAGEFVVVLCRYTGRGRESGAAVDTSGAHVWTIREGKAVRLEVFSSRDKAFEAAELRE